MSTDPKARLSSVLIRAINAAQNGNLQATKLFLTAAQRMSKHPQVTAAYEQVMKIKAVELGSLTLQTRFQDLLVEQEQKVEIQTFQVKKKQDDSFWENDSVGPFRENLESSEKKDLEIIPRSENTDFVGILNEIESTGKLEDIGEEFDIEVNDFLKSSSQFDKNRTSEVRAIDQAILIEQMSLQNSFAQQEQIDETQITRPQQVTPIVVFATEDENSIENANEKNVQNSVLEAYQSHLTASQLRETAEHANIKCARTMFKSYKFIEAYECINKVSKQDPDASGLESLRKQIYNVYGSILEARLAPLDRSVHLLIEPAQIYALGINPKTMFLLTQVDGFTTIRNLIDLSGTSIIQACTTLISLFDRKIIGC